MTFLLFVFWYIVGGLLPALAIGKAMGVDVRLEGSGNPGARNVGRVLGKSAFFVVLFLDAAKGALPVLVSRSLGLSPTVQLLLLFAVVLGHCYPVIHRFRGGKGAGAFVGGLLVFSPLALLAVLLLGAAMFQIVEEKTKGSVLALSAIVPVILIMYGWAAGGVAVALVALLFVTHDLLGSLERMRKL